MKTLIFSIPHLFQCAQYAAHGMGFIVLQAVLLTASVTAALTLYTLRSKRDFSFMGAGCVGRYREI